MLNKSTSSYNIRVRSVFNYHLLRPSEGYTHIFTKHRTKHKKQQNKLINKQENGVQRATKSLLAVSTICRSVHALMRGCSIDMKKSSLLFIFLCLVQSCAFLVARDINTLERVLANETLTVATPTFSPDENIHIASVTVRIYCATEGVSLYYTINGDVPDATSSRIAPGDPIFIDDVGMSTVRAIGVKSGMRNSAVATKEYTVQDRCKKPTITPNGGTFAGAVEVHIVSDTPGASIRYTTDESTPTETSPALTGPLSITSSMHLKAIATKASLASSPVSEAVFTIVPKVATPIITPHTAVFTISATLTITCATPNVTIYYTLDGTEPTSNSLTIVSGASIVEENPGRHVLKVQALHPTMLPSDMATKEFTILERSSPPIFDPPPGTYVMHIDIVSSCADAASGFIYYTTDGKSTPTSASSSVSCGDIISLSGPGKYTLRAYAQLDSKSPSSIIEVVYTLRRPLYDTHLINNNYTMQMRPEIEVVVVAKSFDAKSRYCDKRNVRGRLAILSNPIGHFDIAEPLTGCSKGFVLPSETGRHFRSKALSRLEASLPATQLEKWSREYDAVKNNGCELVTNAGFFNVTSGACFGNVVTNGYVVQKTSRHNVNFGIRNNSFVVGYLSEDEVIGSSNHSRGFDTLISGLLWLVRDGEVYVDESMSQSGDHEDMSPQSTGSQFATILSARTALGYDKFGNLLLLQVEGESWVRGMDLFEFAAFAVELGFVSAINLDGGGSATMTINHTLVSEPSWKCSDPQTASYRTDKYSYCEKRVSSITCMHAMPPPRYVAPPATPHPTSSPTLAPVALSASPTPSPSRAPTIFAVSPIAYPNSPPTPVPTFLQGSSALANITLSAWANMQASETFYRYASYSLLGALLISIAIHFAVFCRCFPVSAPNPKPPQLSNYQDTSYSPAVLSHPQTSLEMVKPYEAARPLVPLAQGTSSYDLRGDSDLDDDDDCDLETVQLFKKKGTSGETHKNYDDDSWSLKTAIPKIRGKMSKMTTNGSSGHEYDEESGRNPFRRR